jgi:cobalt-zinc-cadmium efflux system membrane fusion protein
MNLTPSRSPHRKKPMNRITIITTWLVAAAALAACGQGSSDQAASATVKPVVDTEPGQREESGHSEQERVVLTPQERDQESIAVEALAASPVREAIEVTAVIQPNQNRLARVAPRVPARVVNVYADLGQRVRAGQTLALMDSVEVGEAHAAFFRARSELDVARANLDRAEKLQAEQIIAQKEYLRIRSEHERAAIALHAAEDRLRILGVAIPSAADGNGASMFSLRAPFTGTVIEKDAVVGELASPEKPVFTIADLSVLWIEADLYEKDLSRVRKGAEAEIRVAAYPDRVFTGRLTYLSEIMDRETRTIKGRIEVRNTEGLLKPEMFATATVATTTSGKAVSVPQEAVVLMDGKPTVFVEENGGFEPREVTTGRQLSERIMIESGVEEGELVVVRGAYALKARLLKSELGEGHAH